MANEATLMIETELPIMFTCANGLGIEKGTILRMLDPMTVSGSIAVSDIVAGIAAAEKIASDGTTKLAVYRHGIFKVTLSGSCTVGDPLMTSEVANKPCKASELSGMKVLGYALETGADTETILMELNPHSLKGMQ